MNERQAVTLELARNELTRSGQAAGSGGVISVASALLGAGNALDKVLSAYRDSPDDAEAQRSAVLYALFRLEGAFMRLQAVHKPEAYQVLLDLAYR